MQDNVQDDDDDGDDDGDDDDDGGDDDDDVKDDNVEAGNEMQVNISQEPLYTEIYRKNAAPQSEHPDQAAVFTITVRTRQCGHTVWENK